MKNLTEIQFLIVLTARCNTVANRYDTKDNKTGQSGQNETIINYTTPKATRNGMTLLDSIENVEYGKFVQITDPEGNKIELGEPVDSVFIKMGRATIK